MCQPHEHEGLGIRHLEDQNTSFLLKIGFNLVMKDNALWVKVLRAKCKMSERIPETIAQGNYLAIWHKIAKVWPVLRENLYWFVGTRSSIRCWEDSWVPEVGPLKALVSTTNSPIMDCPLKDMFTGNGT